MLLQNPRSGFKHSYAEIPFGWIDMNTFNHANGLLIFVSAVKHDNVFSADLALIHYCGRLFRYLQPFLPFEIEFGRFTAKITIHAATALFNQRAL